MSLAEYLIVALLALGVIVLVIDALAQLSLHRRILREMDDKYAILRGEHDAICKHLGIKP